MLAYVFPGQGSQSVGMGAEYFDEFKELTDISDKILGYSIKKLCLEDPEGKLGFTQYTQPALYVVNAMMYLKKVQENGMKPDYVAGHSLGEYNALFAAEVFDFATGLKLVKKRGELMGQAKNGGMAAILGMDEEAIREVIENGGLSSIDIANLNSSSQTVISGIKSDIEAAQEAFEMAGAMKYVMLNVSGAFHSRYMADAQKQFSEYMEQFEFKTPKIPVISNVYARPYKNNALKETLLKQITSSVRWCESVRYMMGKGVEDIIQIGPGGVLTGLTRKIKRESEPLIVVDEEISSNVETVDILEQSSTVVERDEYKVNVLGSKGFKEEYKLKYAYLTGPMYYGISSTEMVEKSAKAGMLGFYGAAGVELSKVEKSILYLKSKLGDKYKFGVNLTSDLLNTDREEKLVDLLLKYGVDVVEASSYINVTSAIARYKINGLFRDESGKIISNNKIIAKLSRPEVAVRFLSPIPTEIINKLLSDNRISKEQADMAKEVSLANDICVESDSAGHTDCGVAFSMIPSMARLKDEMMEKYNYKNEIRLGCAGGIGTPEAIVASMILNADFVMSGSINQCTVEAATSETVKNMLQDIDIQDTEHIPSGDNFEFGAKAQIMKKGVLSHVRANKLYEVYKMYNSIDEIDANIRNQIETRYFEKTFNEIFNEIKTGLSSNELSKASKNPKYKMSIIFKWYFDNGNKAAIEGNKDKVVDYMINCSSALGAFNNYVKGTELEDWHNRHVDTIGIKLMEDATELLNKKIKEISTIFI